MKKKLEEMPVNMTPMIDVVFQLIIFFITTIDLQNKDMDIRLKMAMAPHGKPVEAKDPRTVHVDVDAQGRISILHQRLTVPVLRAYLRKAHAEYGRELPVVIRGDMRTSHEAIRAVMDACSEAGLRTVKFGAIKEPAKREGG